jgi:hypothetical protein
VHGEWNIKLRYQGQMSRGCQAPAFAFPRTPDPLAFQLVIFLLAHRLPLSPPSSPSAMPPTGRRLLRYDGTLVGASLPVTQLPGGRALPLVTTVALVTSPGEAPPPQGSRLPASGPVPNSVGAATVTPPPPATSSLAPPGEEEQGGYAGPQRIWPC